MSFSPCYPFHFGSIVTAALLASQSPEDAAEKKVDFQGDMNADRAAELDRLVEAGDWAEVVAAAAKYEMANQSPMMVPTNKPPSPRPITSSAPPADPNDYYYYKVMNGGAEVYLISQGVGNDGAKQIAQALRDPNCKVLELGLGYNNFGVEGSMAIAEALTTNATLQTLWLNHNTIGVEGATAIAKALTTNGTLHRLELNHNTIGVEGARAMAKALTTNATLHWLELSNNTIGNEGAGAIAKALTTNATLQKLYLGNNSIGVEAATAIAEALTTNATLKTLYLNFNTIGVEGATAIAKALTTNATLHRLELDDNKIGDEGARAIAEALTTNTTLQQLELDDNKIGDEGAMAMAEALTTNTTLHTLYLNDNKIGKEGARAIAEALTRNATLHTLWLDNNKIGKEGARIKSLLLEQNRLKRRREMANQSLMKVPMNNSPSTRPRTSLSSKQKTTPFAAPPVNPNDYYYYKVMNGGTKVYLNNKGIGDEGAKQIAQALREINCKVQELGLGDNTIEVEGATAIAKALTTNATLHRLELDDNKIGDRGARAIAKELTTNATLQELYLGNNKIGDEGAWAIAEALTRNATLHTLWLGYNDISQNLMDLIQSLLSKENREKRRREMANQSPKLTSKPIPPPPPPAMKDDHDKILTVLVHYDAGPAELSSVYFERALRGDKVSLGAGAFGEVFWFQDDTLSGMQFAIKRMRLGLDDVQRTSVQDSFRTEITLLQRFRHPNIVRMYGYHISTKPDGTHYLLYEFASQGSLESMLKTEEGLKNLTFPRRLEILFGVAQGLHFLHTGKHLDPNGKTNEKYTALHRDVKSANICISSSFGAKLIDCGLGKIVAQDEKILESFAKSAQFSSGGDGRPGTPAYRDPGYTDGEYRYESYCDVFSFGVVMAEVFTGTLSGIGGITGSGRGGIGLDTRNIYSKYVKVNRRTGTSANNLRTDVDPLIANSTPRLLDDLCLMSLDCMDEDAKERPSAFQIMTKLLEMIHGDKPNPTTPTLSPTALVDPKRCSVCNRMVSDGLSCSNHFVCAEDLSLHKGIPRGEDPLECMVKGCRKCYRQDDIHRCLPAVTYNSYHMLTFFNKVYMPILYEFGNDIRNLRNDIRNLGTKSDRALAAMAYLASGEKTPCPKLVWIVPERRSLSSGAKGMKDFLKDVFFQETAVYFLCEQKYSKGHEDPIIMNFGRTWVNDLLPLIKLSLISLRLAGAVTTGLPGLPITLPGVSCLEDLISKVLEHESSIRETLQDMEQWVTDIAEKRESTLGDERVDIIKTLVGNSYEVVKKKALKEKNVNIWHNSMGPKFKYDDKGESCRIQWIKL
jgi:serine/threonine protein kinase/Ran GTPase-activating protein (RanGAP) involved in mRNA processing and transport